MIGAVLLAALKADLAIPGRWLMISATVTTEDHGEEPTVETIRNVTATMQCEVRGLTLVFMLSGPDGSPPATAKVFFQGTVFESDDADLIARIDNAVPALIAFREAELLAALEAEVEQ